MSLLLPCKQARLFVSVLYEKDDLIELRPIETWTDSQSGKKRSRLICDYHWWLTPGELCSAYNELASFNRAQRANVFVGVNPRPHAGATKKRDIPLCRSVWADFDNITIDGATLRWQSLGLPPPSIVVCSGTGVHVYWFLDKPCEVHRTDCRMLFESILRALYLDLGSDAIQDVSRLLRLPGFLNMKEARNRRPSIPCSLVECDRDRRYSMATFERWVPTHPPKAITMTATQQVFRKQKQLAAPLRDHRNSVRRLLDRFDESVDDRSRRDFAVICGLLRIGISDQQLWRLVCDKSKFRTRNRSYFETTVENAKRDLFT